MVFNAMKVVLVVATCAPAALAQDRGAEYFENHIRPLLAERCYGCHSTRMDKRQGGLVLDEEQGWLRGGERGAGVVPGDAAASWLIRAVRYEDPDLQMPPSEPLPAEAVAHLETWVQMGAPGPGAAVVHTDPSDPLAGRDHWAFQPLQRPAVPAVGQAEWPRSPIDHFVLARLEDESLTHADDAQPWHLIRRVSLLLTGLPPTEELTQRYARSPNPETLACIVDQLLSQPQFGERWGRHWLDLARYADSNGLDENFLFREAWRYRNWVLQAVNEDLPFSRFLLEQIAGDLLPYETAAQRDRQRIAAGFLVVGPKVLLGVEPQRQRMEVADEQIDTIGRAVLGQTLGCARCHDHKFDPIPTADYYALAGIFTSTQVMEQRYMLGQQRVMERLAGLGAQGHELDEAYEAFWRAHPQRQEQHKHAQQALTQLEMQDEAALAELLKQHADAVHEAARDTSRTWEERCQAQKAFVAELAAILAAPPSIPPRAMVPEDVQAPAAEHIRLSGQFDRLGEKVPRGFLRVLSFPGDPEIPGDRSGRIALARWLTDPSGPAGQLAARVHANRVWHHLMGRGLVRTVDNFGRTGEPPEHLELLDHLACELIDSGWSTKHLVRQIVLSRTFSLSSNSGPQAETDPENRLWWRGNRRRLDPEALRDSLLAVAGQLCLSPRESTVWYLPDQATAVGENKIRRRTDFPCRSVYLPVIRNDLPELFEVFDFADPHSATGARPQTTVPTQGLFLLNDAMIMDAAEATARQVLAEAPPGDLGHVVDLLFRRITNTKPATEERDALQTFIESMQAELTETGEADAQQRAVALACHALFASSRFQYME